MRRLKIWNRLLVIMMISALVVGCSRADRTILTPEVSTGTKDAQNEAEDSQGQETTDQDTTDGAVTEVGDEPATEPVHQGITVNYIDFEAVDLNTLSEEVLAEIENLKISRGYAYWPQEDGSFLIFISAGEKPNGGYGISVEAIEDNEGKTIINVIESESSKDDMTIQILSYPYVVIKATGITDNFVISDQNQSEYPLLTSGGMAVGGTSGALGETVLRFAEGSIDYSKPIQGIYQGQVDNQSIEVRVGELNTTFSAEEMDRFLDGIEVGDKIEITVEISPSDQISVTNINKIQ